MNRQVFNIPLYTEGWVELNENSGEAESSWLQTKTLYIHPILLKKTQKAVVLIIIKKKNNYLLDLKNMEFLKQLVIQDKLFVKNNLASKALFTLHNFRAVSNKGLQLG